MDRVTVNQAGVRALLRSRDVEQDLERRAERVAAAARASAPKRTGELAERIVTETVHRPDRTVARVVADVPYAAKITAENPFLAAALDAAR